MQSLTKISILLDSRGMGGIESHVGELAEGLVQIGFRPLVVFLQDYGSHPLKDRLDASGIQWKCAGGFRGLLSILREAQPDVLHAHGYKSGIIGRFAALLSGVASVTTFHAGETPKGKLIVYDFLDRWTSFLGKRISVSEKIADRIPFGSTLIPNFVFVPELVVSDRPNTVAFVGRLSHEKGPDIFVKLASMNPNVSFIVFGDGPMLQDCKAAAGNNIEFVGSVPGMADHWKRIGLLAITSRAEGLPLAALEAMANGVPVAAFDVGGLSSLIDDGVNGYLIEAGNLDDLSGAVKIWNLLNYDHPAQRRAMSISARNTIKSRFGREAGINSLVDIYRNSI